MINTTGNNTPKAMNISAVAVYSAILFKFGLSKNHVIKVAMT